MLVRTLGVGFRTGFEGGAVELGAHQLSSLCLSSLGLAPRLAKRAHILSEPKLESAGVAIHSCGRVEMKGKRNCKENETESFTSMCTGRMIVGLCCSNCFLSSLRRI